MASRRAVGARWVKSRDARQHVHASKCVALSPLYFSRSPTAPQLTQYSSGSTRPPKMSKRMPASVLRRTEERAGKQATLGVRCWNAELDGHAALAQSVCDCRVREEAVECATQPAERVRPRRVHGSHQARWSLWSAGAVALRRGVDTFNTLIAQPYGPKGHVPEDVPSAAALPLGLARLAVVPRHATPLDRACKPQACQPHQEACT